MKHQDLNINSDNLEDNKDKISKINDFIPENSSLTLNYSQDSTTDKTHPPSKRQWRNGARVTRGRKMKSPSKIRLWGITLATPFVIFGAFFVPLNLGNNLFNFISVKIHDLRSEEFYTISEISLSFLIIFLGVLTILSPWVLDSILKLVYSLSSLPISELENKSPESVKLLTQYAQQRRIPLPSLKLLPTSSPVALTYGNHPRNACIVISRGLLNQLRDEEIATVYATQLGHIINHDVIPMTAIVALLQIPYLLYSGCVAGADRWKLPGLRQIFLILSTLCYGIYQFWRLPALWLSRQRLLDSDYQGIQLTQNPNALSRALLKMSIGISQKIQQQGYTPPLLESFDLLLPLHPKQAITIGSLAPDISYESVLSWDCINPYRHWLGLFDSHPLLGERLYLLGRYAKFWKLESELDLSEHRPSWQSKGELWTKLVNSYKALPILPASIVFALGFGVLLKCLFGLIGKVSSITNFKLLSWIDTSFAFLSAWVLWLFILSMVIGLLFISDRQPHFFVWIVFLRVMMGIVQHWSGGRLDWFDYIDPFFKACCLIALSFSLILWQNRYFSHSENTSVVSDPSLGDLLSNPEAVPGQPQLIRLSGIVLGCSKINHWFGQELFLQTSTGLIKLEFMGLVGNIIPWPLIPKQLIKKPVTVQGWFRRGSFPVIEVDVLKLAQGRLVRSGVTHFFFLLIVISAVWGAYLIKTQ